MVRFAPSKHQNVPIIVYVSLLSLALQIFLLYQLVYIFVILILYFSCCFGVINDDASLSWYRYARHLPRTSMSIFVTPKLSLSNNSCGLIPPNPQTHRHQLHITHHARGPTVFNGLSIYACRTRVMATGHPDAIQKRLRFCHHSCCCWLGYNHGRTDAVGR